MLVGDDMKAPEVEGTLAVGINSRSPLQRRTLFQDIFGKSIFDQTPTNSSSGAILQRTAGPVDQTVFDIPAYLAPPVESLFDPLMMGFLKRRPDEADPPPPPDVAGDEDVDMEVDNMNIELVVPSRKFKVEAKEISSLVGLFQTYSLQRAFLYILHFLCVY